MVFFVSGRQHTIKYSFESGDEDVRVGRREETKGSEQSSVLVGLLPYLSLDASGAKVYSCD
jgi:hypothetical protein